MLRTAGGSGYRFRNSRTKAQIARIVKPFSFAITSKCTQDVSASIGHLLAGIGVRRLRGERRMAVSSQPRFAASQPAEGSFSLGPESLDPQGTEVTPAYTLSMDLPSYEEAAGVVRATASRLRPARAEAVPLAEAYGRVLAEPIRADRDQPSFPRSTRDGFAARIEDWPGPLSSIGILKAGEHWDAPVAAGMCLEIMTGAPVPPELDAVAMVEHCERAGRQITLVGGREMTAGENIVPRGAEARAGSVVMPAGTRLTTHGIAAAAACGYAFIQVFARPRVAILATGDELVEVGAAPEPHQIRNSNTWSLHAQARALGGEPLPLAPAPDEPHALGQALREALADADLLLVSGGVSMGQYDLVEPAMAALGGRFHFTGARIQPGKPVVFGEIGGKPFFGLPGNPVSTAVCFALFAAPVLAALGGEPGYTPRFASAELAAAVRNKPGLTRFLPALHTHPLVELIPWQGSGDLASTAKANCFLVVPSEAGDLQQGTSVSILLA